MRSRPVWARGLKRTLPFALSRLSTVAPRVGAWIETLINHLTLWLITVAPRVGAWIETPQARYLKDNVGVAPRVGAWIETILKTELGLKVICRAPCGRVD